MNLEGKVAIVTGAGQGLGLAYAQSLAQAGAVVNDVDAHAADAAARSITDTGGRAVAAAAAVGPASTAQQLIARAVDSFGRLDILVTNAGVLRDKVLWKMTDEEFDAVIDVHLRGTFTCVREAVVRMREQGEGGRIICIGSPAGQRGNFGQTNYSAAKAAIVGMVRTWAMELQRAGITVNAVCPVAATAMTETVPLFAPHIEKMYQRQPFPPVLRRDVGMGTAADAAGIVKFLASDAAADVTGQAVSIGGDRLAMWSHPQLTETAYHDGGWGPDDIAAAWPRRFADAQESVGEEFPEEITAR